MADNSGAEKTSSPLRQILRKEHLVWWASGAVVLTALVGSGLLFSSDWLLFLGLGAGAILALAILWEIPRWQVSNLGDLSSKDRFDRENEARKTLAQILGGVLLLAGLFGSFQSLKLTRYAQESAQLAYEGQIAERFTKAIDQLGAVDSNGKKKLEVRLGGIYALERIANESKRDHWPIIEVLCTYVRVNAPNERGNPSGEQQNPERPIRESDASAPRPHPAADIQAILTVLGRRDTKYEGETQRLDLGDIDIPGADLSGANLIRANLRRSTLALANLSGARLLSADLTAAYVEAADLSGVDLGDAILSGADLTWANLSRANLSGVDLSTAILSFVNLRGADLKDALNLTQQHIDEAQAIGDKFTQLLTTCPCQKAGRSSLLLLCSAMTIGERPEYLGPPPSAV